MGVRAGQMTTLQTGVGSLKPEVGRLGDKVHQHDQLMMEVEREITEQKAGNRAGTGAASSPASFDVLVESMARSGTMSAALFPPKHERTVSVMEGFLYGTERDVICDRLREIFGQEFGVKEWFATGRVGSAGKVNFHTNATAWIFFRKYKGKMFYHGAR